MFRSKKIVLCVLVTATIASCLEIGHQCKVKGVEDGTCKNYFDCPELKNKLQNREISLNDVIKCNNYGVICCPSDTVKIQERISTRKCKEYGKNFTQIYTRVGITILNREGILVPTSKCKHKSIPLIVGGTEVNQYEFPHQALLGYNTANGIEWTCGGSLISSNYILTAAHCNHQSNYRDIKFAKLGMIDRRQNDENVYIYNVTERIEHPEYDRGTYNNDIAILKLDRHVQFSEFLYPICLPTIQHDEHKAIVTGLGTTGKDHALSDKLLKVVLEKFSHKECQNIIRSRKIYNATMICYGERLERKDACRGDSGGPIQVSNDDESHCTYKIIGVVSFGAKDCGTPGVPGVFVNVFNYLSWIEGIVWKDEQ